MGRPTSTVLLKVDRDRLAWPVGKGPPRHNDAYRKADESAEIEGPDNADIECRAKIAGANGVKQQAGGREIIDETDQRFHAIGRIKAITHSQIAQRDERKDGRDNGKNG